MVIVGPSRRTTSTPPGRHTSRKHGARTPSLVTLASSARARHAAASPPTVTDRHIRVRVRQTVYHVRGRVRHSVIRVDRREGVTRVTERFGPYELLRVVGRGGMGEVFEAHDPEHDRVVALKRLAAEAAGDDEYQKRFRREARLVARLRSPHVIPIHS